MDKGLLLFIAVGVIAIYFITSFVDTVQEDERYQNSGYSGNSKDKDIKYQSTNSIGDIILDVSSADAQTQIAVWNRSDIKREFLTNFPNFSDMRDFIDDKVVGDILQQKLREAIDNVEDKFVSGEMKVDEAKRKFTL